MSNEMSPQEREVLIAEFLSESSGFLQDLNQKLVSAEASVNSGAELSDDDLHEMFRAAHNIKGMAAFVGLAVTQTLTHEMETVLSLVRNKDVVFDSHVIDVLFGVFDTLESQFISLKETSCEVTDVRAIMEQLKEIQAKAAAAPGSVQISGPVTEQHVPPGRQASAPEPVPTAIPPAARKPGPEPVSESDEEPRGNSEKYVAKFVDDADHQIVKFNNILLGVEANTATPQDMNELFRIIHTIKGSAGIVGAKKIAKVAHSMENILAYYRDVKTSMGETTVSLLFGGIDAIKEIITQFREKTGRKVDAGPICAMLNSVYFELTSQDAPELEPVVSAPAEPAAPEKRLEKAVAPITQEQVDCAADDVFRIELEIAKAAPLKSVKMILALEKLAQCGRVLSAAPAPDAINDSGTEAVPAEIVFTSHVNEKEIRARLGMDLLEVVSVERLEKNKVAEVSDTEREGRNDIMENMAENNEAGLDGKAQPAGKANGIELSTIRIDSNKLDTLMNLAGELVIVRARFSQLLNMFNREIGVQRDSVQSANHIRTSTELLNKEIRTLCARADHKETKKIYTLMDELNGRAGRLMTQVSKNNLISTIHSFDEITGALGKISSDIQTGVMQARMIPIEGIFTRFKRIVRDIAKSLSKDVILKIEGETTELDKKIVDSLGDPLTHMVRNAVDHGIEDMETRTKAGKSPVGTICLSAMHKGNSIWIEVRDDGRGIDIKKVAELAVRKGLFSEQQLEKMTDKDKLNILFMPGFSTAEKVTNLSGRGVGMDVVKNMISSVNGTIDVETEMGKGTTFILKIPLTLAIIEALLVIIGDAPFAFPLEAVTEIVKVSVDDIYSVNGNDTIKLRDHALSLVELPEVLNVRAGKPAEITHKRIVVITDGNKKVGVAVDELVGEEEIVIKSLPEQFAHVRGITGASILGDGRIALILDPADIINKANKD